MRLGRRDLLPFPIYGRYCFERQHAKRKNTSLDVAISGPIVQVTFWTARHRADFPGQSYGSKMRRIEARS